MSEMSQSEAATQPVDPESYAVILRDHTDGKKKRKMSVCIVSKDTKKQRKEEISTKTAA